MSHLFYLPQKWGKYIPQIHVEWLNDTFSEKFWISASMISESLVLNVFLLLPWFCLGREENSIYWPSTQLRTSESEVIVFHSSRKFANWPALKLCTLLVKYCFILGSNNVRLFTSKSPSVSAEIIVASSPSPGVGKKVFGVALSSTDGLWLKKGLVPRSDLW